MLRTTVQRALIPPAMCTCKSAYSIGVRLLAPTQHDGVVGGSGGGDIVASEAGNTFKANRKYNEEMLRRLDMFAEPKSEGTGKKRQTFIRSPEKSEKKLRSRLDKKKESTRLSPDAYGKMEGTSVDILDILNEALEENSLYELFKGTKRASDVVEVMHVVINQDCSHVTAYWSCDLIEKFVDKVREKHGDIDYKKVHNEFTSKISKKLKSCEPTFRSFLLRKMDFRRVPRIFFRHYWELEDREINRVLDFELGKLREDLGEVDEDKDEDDDDKDSERRRESNKL